MRSSARFPQLGGGGGRGGGGGGWALIQRFLSWLESGVS